MARRAQTPRAQAQGTEGDHAGRREPQRRARRDAEPGACEGPARVGAVATCVSFLFELPRFASCLSS